MEPLRNRRSRVTSMSPQVSSFEFPSKRPEETIRSSQVTPLKASSILCGSVQLLATGRLGIDPRNGAVLEEATVSLSKSSSWMSPQSSPSSYPPTSRSQPDPPATNEEQQQQQQHHHHQLPEESYPQFLDSFQSLDDACSPLDIGRILLEDDDEDLFSVGDTFPSQDVSKPRHRAVKKDPYDEFMTAYTSQGHFGLDFDHLVSPTRFGSKVKIRKLTLPPNLNVSPAGSGTASRSEDVTEREHQCRKEQVFWDTTAATRSRDLGLVHHDTAEAFMSLGHAHLRLNEYDEAMEAFQTSCKIFNALDGPTHLSVGHALDAFGLAALRHYEGGTLYLIQAKTALEEAFAIRFHSLGVWHADTVETFNKIGTVYLHMGRMNEAADAYREVFLVRQAIYGSQHPSVAIVAHGLANILFNMRHLEEARNYFTVAFNIYQSMNLSNRHPAMVRLQVDQSRLLDCKPR